MADEARVELDIDAEMAELMLEGAFIVEESARILQEEFHGIIEISDFPAAAGTPPHSRGPFRDSFKASKARRSGDNNAITAFLYSMAVGQNGESLAEILDEGRGSVKPHPFIREAIRRAERRVEHMLRQRGYL